MMVFSQTAHAQSRKEREAANRALIEERIELLNEDLDENGEVDLTALFDSFNELLERPLNLNSASEDEPKSIILSKRDSATGSH